ncbi:MAG: hypothetical protein IJ986_03605 [Bacteroidales bacterium]|nr:hypothetical protein [Bacteroidales bacterium]
MRPKVFFTCSLLLSLVLSVNAQIDEEMKREAKQIIKESHYVDVYHYHHYDDFSSYSPTYLSKWLSEQCPLVFNGNIAAIQEVRYNYGISNYTDWGIRCHARKHSHHKQSVYMFQWEADPIETAQYTFDTLHQTVVKEVHCIHVRQIKKMKTARYQLILGEIYPLKWHNPMKNQGKGCRLEFSEQDVRYTFKNGMPVAYQTLTGKMYSDTLFWQYVEGIEYDSCNRPTAIFTFYNGRMEYLTAYTYNTDNQIDSIYNYAVGYIYTLPIYPKASALSKRWEASNPKDSTGIRYQYDSDGRLLSITNYSELGALYDFYDRGSRISIHTILYEYDSQGNVIQKTFLGNCITVRGAGGQDSHQASGSNDRKDGNDWKCQYTFKYQYDERGNWTECEEFIDGKLSAHTTRTITYGE